MKKLLCSLLALLMCLSCLVGCLGPEEVKPLTAADIVVHVNQTVESLNGLDFSTVTPEQIAGEGTDIHATIEELKKLKGQISLKSEVNGETTNATYALSDGMLFLPDTDGMSMYYAVVGDALAVLVCEEQGGETFAQASYMLLSSLLGDMEMPDLSDTENNPLASIDLALPLMTEEDITVDGTTFIIKNSYITNAIKALLDSLPAELTSDASDLAAVKTMLPGLLDNLGLRIALEAKGASVVGFSISFDANEDFNALLEIPADTVIKGGCAITMTDDGQKLNGLQLDLEVTDVVDLDLTAGVTYTDSGVETVTLGFDCDLPGIEVASESIPTFDEMMVYDELYYSVEADMAIHLDLTVSPMAVLPDAPQGLQLVDCSFSSVTQNGRATLDGEPAADTDEFAAAMLEDAIGTTAVTVTSNKTNANTTVVVIEAVPNSGEKSTVELTLTLGEAPDFVAPSAEASSVLNEDYLALYEELVNAVAESGLYGGFDYMTEDGNTITFVYYGASNSFNVINGHSANPYYYHITNEQGEYKVQQP